jgi:hypothetical protein
MTSDYPTFSVRVPRGFKPRFASVFRPSPGIMGGPDKHGCCFPADELPAGSEEWLGTYVQHRGFQSIVRERDGVRCAMARSSLPPVVLPGTGQKHDWDWWQHQLARCDAMNLPRDFLLREMELRLLVQPFEWRSPVPSFRSSGITLNLKAVQVVSPMDDRDLTKLLADTRAAIEEGGTR